MQTKIKVGDKVRIQLLGAIGKVTDIEHGLLYRVYVEGRYIDCMPDWIEKLPES